jgi:hypothetical protein
VVVGVGYGVYRLSSSLDSIVKAAIEKYGSEATGTSVEVAGVDIGVREGRATVTGLVVGNPDGFDGDAFTLGEITVDIDSGNFTKEPVVVDRITIGAPAVSVIVHQDGTSNLDVIRRNLDAASGGGGGGEGDGAGSAGKRIRIQRFVFAEGRIMADATAVGAEKPIEVHLPTMEITNVGGNEGAPPDEIARSIAKAYSKRVAEVAAKEGLEAAAKKGLLDKAKDLFD